MNITPRVLITLSLLSAGLAFAQEEQSVESEAAAKFWTSPRVEQTPPATKSAAPENAAAGQPLTIDNETLEARWSGGEITVTFKATKRNFHTNGSFKATGGSAKVTTVTDKTFGPGKAIEISYVS